MTVGRKTQNVARNLQVPCLDLPVGEVEQILLRGRGFVLVRQPGQDCCEWLVGVGGVDEAAQDDCCP